jgi:TolA-binding protein
MRESLTDWRWRVVGLCGILAGGWWFSAGAARAQDAPDSAKSDAADKAGATVDAAAKQLMAANGLYARGLFQLASQEYAGFLRENLDHPQRLAALYSLAVCQYRLNDYAKAATLLRGVLKDGTFARRAEALAVLGQCEMAGKRYAEAVAAWDELLSKYPTSPQAEPAAVNRVQSLYLLGRYADASTACARFTDAHPRSASRAAALYFQALALRALGKDDEAIAAVDRLLAADADRRYAVDAPLIKGQALESMGKFDAAAAQYERMLAEAPPERKCDASYALGTVLVRAGKYDPAIKALSSVSDGAYAKPARLQLGLALLAADKPGEARAALDEVARNDPERAASARYALARCDMAERKYESAREQLGQLLAVRPAPASATQIALDRAICLMELGKFDAAATELEALASRAPADAAQAPEVLYRLAFCLHKAGKFDTSHAACERLASLGRSDFARGGAEVDAENLFLLARYADAARAFEALATGAGDDRRALVWKMRMGQCAYFAGDYGKAVDLLSPLAADQRFSAAAELRPAIFLLGDALLQQGKNRPAAEALEKYVAVATGDLAEAKFKLALARLRSNDADGAGRALAELTAGNADSPWVQRGLVEYGQLLERSGKLDQAATALRRVLDAAPPAPEDLAAPATYLLACVAFDQKQYAQAADLWKQLVDRFGSHALADDAAFRRGVALKEAGKPDEAATALQAYADGHPQSANAPRARQLAAASLSAQGKNDQATAILASLAMSPKAADTVLYDLAWAQRAQKNEGAAAETYARLLKDQPESKLAPAVRVELAEILYGQQKYDQAAALLEAAASADALDAKVRGAAVYRLGWCYQKLGKPDRAADAFARFDPKASGADDQLAASAVLQSGLAYADAGKLDQAEPALTRMLKEYPANAQAPVALLKLGEVQAERQQYDESAATFQTYLRKYPKDAFAGRAHFGIGWAMENQKRYDDARAAYKNAIAATNTEIAARAQFQTGETYLFEGKFNEAIPALLAVEDVYAYPTWSARASLEAGRAFEQLNQVDQARKQFEQLLSKYKDAPEAAVARERLAALAAAR